MRGLRGRGTRRLATLVALSLLGLVVMAGAAAGARAGGHSADNFTFSCTLNGVSVGGGTVRFSITTVNGDTVGWYRFDGNNGQSRRYRVDYTSTTDGAGSTTSVGTIVSNGGFDADWLYIDGTAVYAPNGLLGSYTGTAVNICQDLGFYGP